MNRKVLVCVVFSALFLFVGTSLICGEAIEDSDIDTTQTYSEGEVPEAVQSEQSEPVGYYDADGNLYSTETDDAGSGSTSSSDVSPDTVNINDVPEDAVVQSPSPEDTDSSEDSAEE